MHKVTNDFKFDAVKDDYCPTCYFDKDKLLKRGHCECKKQVVVIKETVQEHDVVDTLTDMAVGYAVGEVLENLLDSSSEQESSSSDSFDGFGGGESGGGGDSSDW